MSQKPTAIQTGLAITCLAVSSQIIGAGLPNSSRRLETYSGGNPGRGKPNWTHIVWIGPQTHPQTVIWLSQDRLKLSGFLEENIVFPSREYRRIERIAIKVNDTDTADKNLGFPRYSFRITQRVGYSNQRNYYLSRASGCRYISKITKAKGVTWTPARKEPFLDYARICEIAGQPLPLTSASNYP
jgi:hypothetical protein